ncbi:uncharacterized protein LOC126769743, partial [Nymphalis io]|uniref:uncharacterized protein LOC126769743 n=1 Tax=Inachis io TaxID=171585 RepID=UPI00216A41A0
MTKCNYECATEETAPDVLEFVGPVKIILVDQTKTAYACKTCYAAMIVMAQMLMATSTIIVMLFSLSYKKSTCYKALHIFLCTVGLQTIIPSGILSLNKSNGSSAPMKQSDRKFEHIFMQCFGSSCAISGAIATYFASFPYIFTLHSYFGLAATGFAILCPCTGLWICWFSSKPSPHKEYERYRRLIYNIHKLFGVLTVLLSSVCFVSGLIKSPFLKWLPLDEMFYLTTMFCVFYTLVIIYKPLK